METPLTARGIEVLWILIKMVHVLGGIATWEIASHLDFDLGLLFWRKRRPWTFWIYLGCRVSFLAAVISGLGGMSVGLNAGCRAWGLTAVLSIDLSFALAMLMVALRIAAIWSKNIPVMVITGLAWVAPLVVYLRNLVMSERASDNPFVGCFITQLQASQMSIFTMTSSFSLLAIMLVGLWKVRHANVHALWNILYRQGLVWLIVVVAAEVPVFIVVSSVDVGLPAYLLLQVPRVVITALGATRMYRSLYNFRQKQRQGNYQQTQRFIRVQSDDPLLVPDPEKPDPALPKIEVHVMSEQVHDSERRPIRHSLDSSAISSLGFK